MSGCSSARDQFRKNTTHPSITQKLNMPKAGDYTGQSRYSSTNEPFYKGEKNLKNMDRPAIHRRGFKNITALNKAEEEENKQKQKEANKAETEQKKGDELLNNRRERIDKSDSNQPAFLRKIMEDLRKELISESEKPLALQYDLRTKKTFTIFSKEFLIPS